jgi:hypothetical protein
MVSSDFHGIVLEKEGETFQHMRSHQGYAEIIVSSISKLIKAMQEQRFQKKG